MFKPINPPPSDHHGFAMGLSTEFGDTAKNAMEKVNAGFAHVYGVLKGLGATLADEVEYVAKSEFDALVHELDETKAELNNLKMMVQGLGFAGAAKPIGVTTEPVLRVIAADLPSTHTITDPHSTVVNSEPVVTVSEKTEQ